MTRSTLRRKLKAAGLPSASDKHDASGFTITEFVDYWGVLHSAPGYGADTADITRALDNAGIQWEMGNCILVPKTA